MPLSSTRWRAGPTLLIGAVLLAGTAAGAAEVIPSSRCRGLFIVDARFGAESFALVLDTGAESTILDPDAIWRGLRKRVVAGKRTTVRDGVVGPLRLPRLKVTAREMDDFATALGRPIDGILGIDAFDEVGLILDYPGSEVRVESPPAGARRTDPGVLRDVGKARPFFELTIGAKRVPVLVDSGFTGSLALLAEDPLDWEVPPRPIRAAQRYSGTVLKRAGRLASTLELGTLRLERPVVELAEGARLLGAGAMATLVVTVDRPNREIGVRSTSGSSLTFAPVVGSGLGLTPRSDGLEVFSVLTGSAAEQAGIEIGDVVVAVDGVPIGERTCVSLEGSSEPRRVAIKRRDAMVELVVRPSVLVP